MRTIHRKLPPKYRDNHIPFSVPCFYKSKKDTCEYRCLEYGLCLYEQYVWFKTYRELGLQRLRDTKRFKDKTALQNLELLSPAEKELLILYCDNRIKRLRIGEKMRRAIVDNTVGTRSDRLDADAERRLDKLFEGTLSTKKTLTMDEVLNEPKEL